ncbi:MAG TPA: DUF1002 domain-containing protein [Clostridia bacterium]|nr:DUF1002 domain-containing protein [Clostridia bacterium]
MKRTILIVFALLLLPLQVFAVANWQEQTFVYGGGLSQEQIKQTSQLLGIKEGEAVLESPIYGEDLESYIGGEPTLTKDMISSALVIKKEKGSGVNVEIKTPENISLVSKEQYEGAAVTAGIGDVTIFIASPFGVTGESALAGVYKAFELNGEDLSRGAMVLAQEEIEVVTGISEDIKDEEDFDKAKLAQAMVEIKEEIIAAIEKEGSITREEIRRIIEDILDRLDLSNLVSSVHIDSLVNFFVHFSETEGLDFSQMKEQLKGLGEELAPRVKELLKEAEDSGLLDRIAIFFKELLEKIMSFLDE